MKALAGIVGSQQRIIPPPYSISFGSYAYGYQYASAGASFTFPAEYPDDAVIDYVSWSASASSYSSEATILLSGTFGNGYFMNSSNQPLSATRTPSFGCYLSSPYSNDYLEIFGFNAYVVFK